ncbi:MAG TPA: haloacid dehalogenase [Deltaproteobacteria bacterium]|nr:haloacid dehalogenase [Deltaproteobacteria bacterium]HQI81697.1 haloacid dehalogenase [Deltaproteobacteria bacterium]
MTIPPAKLAFDFDGVIADTFRLFVRMAREQYHYDFAYDDITEYEFLKSVHMDRAHASEIIEVLTNEPHAIDLFPNEGARDTLARLISHAPLLVVTARPFPEPVALWFDRHIPEIGRHCLRIEATGVNTAKLDILKGLKVEYFVEDRLDTCHLLQEAGITPIVFTQPWNRRPHPFITVSTWEEMNALIDWSALGSVNPPSPCGRG